VTIEIRAVPIDDPVSLALDNQVWIEEAVTPGETRAVADWYREHQSWLALEAGDPRGTAFVGIPPHRDEIATRIAVPPQNRGRGVGTALWDACSRWAAECGHDELHAWIPGDDPDALAWATRRGYVETSREDMLVLDLPRAELPRPDPPAGIELTTLAERPALERGVYDVAAEAWLDIPGHAGEEIESFEDWHRLFVDEERFPPAGTVIALVAGEVVGYTQLHLRPGNRAWHAMTGVKRDWRGRGIAGALKVAQLRWAKEAGIARITTLNETRNEPIRRLNERLGYRVEPGRIRVRGPLAPTSAEP
jgi:GNAT superfamily N-acetyltransferase